MTSSDLTITDDYTGDLSETGPQRRTLSNASIVKISVGPMDNNVYIVTSAATGDQLIIDAANDAYLTGMNVATGAGALIALGAAAAGWWGIREYSRRIEESVHHPQEISPR